MDFQENDTSMSISLPKNSTQNYPSFYRLMNGSASSPSSWFEIRLFYVRITPCVIDSAPSHLTLRHLRREIGVSLDINGSRIPASETVSLTLRRDRLDKDSSEVTYVSTDSVRVAGPVEFEVYEREDLMLCVSLERIESSWSNGSVGFDHQSQRTENDSKTGWSMDCCIAASITTGSSAFFQPIFGVSSPSIEVYVAGWSSGFPLILTKIIHLSPRRKSPRHATLHAIPEDEETEKDQKTMNDIARHMKFQASYSLIRTIVFYPASRSSFRCNFKVLVHGSGSEEEGGAERERRDLLFPDDGRRLRKEKWHFWHWLN